MIINRYIMPVGIVVYLLILLCAATGVHAAQQAITTITSGTGTTGLNLKQYNDTYINPRLTNMAAMILMPSLRDIINYEPLIDYVYRTSIHGAWSANDPCVTPDTRENFTTCDPYRNTGCTYYGVTWGPITPTDTKSQCITTPTSPYTKVGRFLAVDGTKVGAAYTSGQIETNWSTIVALDPGYPIIPPDPEATCSDGIQNGTETGIDCGGSCSACPPGTVGSFFPFKSNGKATKISQ